MENRFDIFKVPHKAQRRALFLASIAIGRLGPGDEAAAQALSSHIHQLIAHIRDHSASEDRYILPLLRKVENGAETIEAGHHEVEALMADVDVLLREGALHRGAHDFYRLFNRMVAAYLAHIEREEAAQVQVLWPNYSDTELLAAQTAFVTQRNPMSNLSDLAFILPSLSVAEICDFLGSLRRDVPDEPFATLLAVARRTLEPRVWSAVESHLRHW